MTPGELLQFIYNSLSLSAYYLLFAVGLALVFGVMKTVNFAHGELYMIGAYIGCVLFSFFAGGVPGPLLLFIAVVVSMLVVGGLGIAIDQGLFRRVRADLLTVFLMSLGLSYILQGLAYEVFGDVPKGILPVFPGVFPITGAALPIERLVTIIGAVTLVGLLWFFLERTNLGRGLRASAQDSEAGTLQGISFNKVTALAMAVGSALAAAAGVLIGCRLMVYPWVGETVIMKAFIIVIVGGMGSIGGTVIAACLFGFLDSAIQTFLSTEFTTMIDVLIMLAVLAWRPQGLLGRER